MLLIWLGLRVWETQISTLIQETDVHSSIGEQSNQHGEIVSWRDILTLFLWRCFFSYIAQNDSQLTDGVSDKNLQLKDYGRKNS